MYTHDGIKIENLRGPCEVRDKTRKMKKCELCNSVAKMYCDSDQASLCWDCDARVHTANFLVAKHSRILLCHVCQSPTPWTASGPRLGPTVSVCQGCANSTSTNASAVDGDRDPENGGEEDDDDDDDRSDRDESEEEEDDDDDDSSDEDDGDNQVVPLASTPLPPPVASSSSSSEESSKRFSQRIFAVSSSRIGVLSTRADENAKLSYGDRMERSQQKQDYKIS